MTFRQIALPLLAATTLRCGTAPASTPDASDESCGTQFIANNASFADFMSWDSFDAGTSDQDEANVPGGRMVYYRTPDGTLPPGSKTFPVGTMIVKTINGWNTSSAYQTFAMVKRSCDADYNMAGAEGWEWFGLSPNPDGSGTPEIAWSGTQSPVSYGTSGETCNQCHEVAMANDYVPSPQLALASF